MTDNVETIKSEIKQPDQNKTETKIDNDKYYNLETVQKQVEDLIMQVDSYVEWQENQRKNDPPE